jgi:protein Tex
MSALDMDEVFLKIANEIVANENQVRAAVTLLDGGATVPFIARYRKELTGGLDDIQLRALETRLAYLREMAQRRNAILLSIQAQGKLTSELAMALDQAQTKQDLEDIYLPHKPKRRTKGHIAREAGIEPLADQLFANPSLDPQVCAIGYVKSEKNEAGDDFTSVGDVLDGVRDIWSERWAEDAALLQQLRDWLWSDGVLTSQLAAGKDETHPDVAKFRDYFDYDEPIRRIPSHRALAVFRGRQLDLLDVKLLPPQASASMGSPAAPATQQISMAEAKIALHLGWRHQGRLSDDLIRKSVAWTWRVKLSLSMERDLFTRLREAAEAVAIKVFADNLRDLLLAAPAGPRVVMGLDPGIRTGVKVAVVDATGKLMETTTVYPHEPRCDWEGAKLSLSKLCVKHGVGLVAIGNGTASRETDKLAAEMLKQMGMNAQGQDIQRVVVSEAGASVYSASEYASQEMPEVDVSLRGAASIARRLQDPLAELVKIDPKSIGVGQYQHDVNQSDLARTLNAVVEDCVNSVGVDLNTASEPLLSRVSGMSSHVARAMVRWRESHGAFKSRQQLLQITGLGAKTFEQCAGFLRIRNGDNPLDMTGVHPETYPVVEQIMITTGKPITAIMGRVDVIKTLRPEQFVTAQVGPVTVRDILQELEKPGRDPRPDFKVARFNEGVEDIKDLRPDMQLEGTVSNVAAFGAFVDVGVHQDGLVHVSQLSYKFVNDAREVVKTGDIVKVRVVEVDFARKRISLSMRLSDPVATTTTQGDNRHQPSSRLQRQVRPEPTPSTTALASAFAKLKQ